MTYYGSMIILIPAIIFTMYAQAKVNSNFRRYSNVRNLRNQGRGRRRREECLTPTVLGACR